MKLSKMPFASLLAIVSLCSLAHSSVQSIINAACNGSTSGAAVLQAGIYPQTATVTLPSNCALYINNASITASSSLVGDLLSSTNTSNVRIVGPGTLNAAGASTSAQSFPLEFFGVSNGGITDLQIMGSNQGGLNLWGVSSINVRGITFSGLNHTPGASSPAMGIFNWVSAHPTQTSSDVDVSPNQMQRCPR